MAARLVLALAAAFALHTPPAGAHDPAQARYIANEGILIAHGDTKILFDAFFSEGFNNYVTPAAEVQAALLEGRAPYDGIDAIFISHVHGDHFSPGPLIAYLRAQGGVRVFASVQTFDAIAEALGEDQALLDRVEPFDLSPGDAPVGVRVSDKVRADVVAIPHAGNRPEIQNFVWRVTLEDAVTVAQFGDADPKAGHFAPHQDHWDYEPIDVAFPPYWFFRTREGRDIIELIIRPGHAIGVHVPAEAIGNGDVWRAGLEADLFTDPGETRDIAHD